MNEKIIICIGETFGLLSSLRIVRRLCEGSVLPCVRSSLNSFLTNGIIFINLYDTNVVRATPLCWPTVKFPIINIMPAVRNFETGMILQCFRAVFRHTNFIYLYKAIQLFTLRLVYSPLFYCTSHHVYGYVLRQATLLELLDPGDGGSTLLRNGSCLHV